MENDNKKSIQEEMMTEEMESELLKEYPQLPVARQDEGEITVICNSYCGHVVIRKKIITTIQIFLKCEYKPT